MSIIIIIIIDQLKQEGQEEDMVSECPSLLCPRLCVGPIDLRLVLWERVSSSVQVAICLVAKRPDLKDRRPFRSRSATQSLVSRLLNRCACFAKIASVTSFLNMKIPT